MSSLSTRNDDSMFVFNPESKDGELQEVINNTLEWLKDVGYYWTYASDRYLGDLYLDLILNKVIPTTPDVYRECEFIRMRLNNQRTVDFPYYFDRDGVERTILRIQQHHPELILQPNQHLRIAMMIGWIDPTTNKRATNIYFELIGRGNGKTTTIHALILDLMAYSEDPTFNGAYLAGTREKTEELFVIAQDLIRTSKNGYHKRFIIKNNRIHLRPNLKLVRKGKNGADEVILPYKRFNAWYKPTSSSQSHGGKSTVVYVDELHTIPPKTAQSIYTLLNSQGKKAGSFGVFSSTRSIGNNSVLEGYIERIKSDLEFCLKDWRGARNFSFLYYAESLDELWDLRNWLKANPNLMFMGGLAKIVRNFIKHVRNIDTDEAAGFFTQQFNFYDTSERYNFVSLPTLKANNGEFNSEDVGKKPAYIGFDLNDGGSDFTAVYCIVPDLVDGERRVYVEGKAFITEEQYSKKVQSNYYPKIKDWVDDGDVVLMPNNKVNDEEVRAYINELSHRYNIIKVCYDPNYAQAIIPVLTRDLPRVPIVKINQSASTLSTPIRLAQELFRSRGVYFNNNSLFRYFIVNSNIKISRNETVILTKPTNTALNTRESKIDGAVAFIIAIAGFLSEGGYGLMSGSLGDTISLKDESEAIEELLNDDELMDFWR